MIRPTPAFFRSLDQKATARSPFVRRRGKLFLRFNSIVITQPLCKAACPPPILHCSLRWNGCEVAWTEAVCDLSQGACFQLALGTGKGEVEVKVYQGLGDPDSEDGAKLRQAWATGAEKPTTP
jgi:hypothetical protein